MAGPADDPDSPEPAAASGGREDAAEDDLIVVSNREPYAHYYTAEGVECSQPAGGLISALDSVVADLGGTWIAWGSGDADFDPAVLSPDGTIELPPDEPAYALRRLELTRRQVDRYYYGYSNQVLWPLCHLDTNYVDVEPGFWPAYEEVNRRFADAVADAGPAPVWLNPFDTATFAERLEEAVEMDENERIERFERLAETVRSAGIDDWIDANVGRL